MTRPRRYLCLALGTAVLLTSQIASARDDSGIIVLGVAIYLGAAILVAALLFFVLRWLRAPYLRAALRLLIIVSFVAPVPTHPGVCPSGLFWVWQAFVSFDQIGGLHPVQDPSVGFFATAITYLILLPPIFLWTDRRERLRRNRLSSG